MSKYCPKCGTENDDNSSFCETCGERLSQINKKNIDNKSSKNEKILIGVIVVLLIAFIIIGTYAYVTLIDNNPISEINSNNPINRIIDNSNSAVSTENTKNWHKIGEYNGVDDDTIKITSGGNKIKIVTSAMPIKNYANNFMITKISQNDYNVVSSDLSWNSHSAVAEKSDTIELSNSGTYYIYISSYELKYWNLEIYEYY